MSVNLTKPSAIREYTPIHFCDEIYPNQTTKHTIVAHDELRASLAVFLRDAVITSLDSRTDSEENIGLFREIFNTSGNFDADHLIIDDGEVVYSRYINHLFETGDVIVSALLNSLQEVLACIEQPRSSFSSLCKCLEHRWTASTNHLYYLELCSFLADVKSGNVTKIMNILNKESIDFGDNFFDGNSQWNYVLEKFYAAISTRLFSSLYSLLKREKDIEVHPLFLFVCQNYSVADAKVADRLKLCAYGMSLQGVLLPKAKVFPKFFEGILSRSLFDITCLCVTVFFVLVLLKAATATDSILWYISVLLLAIFNLLGPTLMEYLKFITDNYNDNMRLYGGLKCFLEAQGATMSELPTGMTKFLQKYEHEFGLLHDRDRHC